MSAQYIDVKSCSTYRGHNGKVIVLTVVEIPRLAIGASGVDSYGAVGAHCDQALAIWSVCKERRSLWIYTP